MTRFRPHLSRPWQQGLTMVEMMITLAIMAILLAVAIPSFQGLIASTRLTSLTNEFITALTQAKSDAVRRGTRVTICMSANGNQCNNAGSWDQGWIIFTDTTRAGNVANVDAGETILHVYRGGQAGIVIQGQAALPRYISFSSDGQSRTLVGAVQAGTIEVCSTSTALADDERARDLQINASGQVVLTRPIGINNGCPPPP